MSDDQRSIYLESAHDEERGHVCPSCEEWYPECEYAQDCEFCDACEEATDEAQ
jgi:hypothetical protein